MRIETTARNAEMPELLALLERQHETKYDVVVPSTHLTFMDGWANIAEGRTIFDEEGAGLGHVRLQPTAGFDNDLAQALGIPTRYLRRMREEAVGLLDENVNHWIGESDRNWFVRAFAEIGGATGIARAFLSDRYQVIDHLDAVIAVLSGLREAGIDSDGLRLSGDLSENRLRLKMVAPEITTGCVGFLGGREGGYRNPTGEDGPRVISAGLTMSNSETGSGAFNLAPYITVEICSNGMTRTQDAMRKIHLGAQMGEGQIEWSAKTKRANVELIQAQAADAVASWLTVDYLDQVADELGEKGSKILERPHEVVDKIGEDLGYTETERLSILDYFTRGGDVRAGGVVNAFTAFARDLDDPERAIEVEEQAFAILDRAAARA